MVTISAQSKFIERAEEPNLTIDELREIIIEVELSFYMESSYAGDIPTCGPIGLQIRVTGPFNYLI